MEAAKRVVLLTVFLDILGFGIIIPQLAIYASQFGASPAVVGVLASTYSAMGFLFTPFWGRLSDRVGRRPVLLWSILGTTIGYVFFALAQSLPLLFAARMIDGITGANISTAQAYLTDTTAPADRTKTFGLFGAIFGIGFAVGPLIGAQLSHLPGAWGGNFGIGMFTAALSFVNWLLAIRRLPETLTPEMRASNTARQAERGDGRWQIINAHGYKSAFALPGLNLVLAISFFSILAFSTMQGTFTLYLLTKFVRPAVQMEIRHNPPAAVHEAQVRLSQGAGHTASISTGDEGATPALTSGVVKQGDVPPYDPAIGGDFTLRGVAPPASNLSWRHVEQLLVQPRAARLVNWLFTTIGILAIIVQGGLIRPLKKYVGDVPLIIVGTLIMAIALALVPMPDHFVWQFPIVALLAIGNSISAPVLTAMVSILSPEAERGEIIGVFQSTQSLGRIIGPTLGGLLFNSVSVRAPYFAGGAIMFISCLLAFGLRGREPLPAQAS